MTLSGRQDHLQRGGGIPGTDKADEMVMLGGHLDSWHAATGATDNAIGSSIMMEAARLIQALGLKPRRTIRVALWSGEEEGLLGSLAYVKQHFGSVENPKPEYASWIATSISIPAPDGCAGRACLRSSGSGRGAARGAGTVRRSGRGRSRCPTTSRAVGGTDSTSFNNAGLPGVGLQQDPDRIPDGHLAHQPGYLRAHRPRRRMKAVR